jgi:hypothetical protein
MDDQTSPRRYFSERQGRGPRREPLPFEKFRRLVISVVEDLRVRDYFQEAFGYRCVDAGEVPGTVGRDVEAYFLRTLGRERIWPYWEPDIPATDFVPGDYEPDVYADSWDADTLFDVVEVLHDLVSEPGEGRHHDYNNCGWHYSSFNRATGQDTYRREMNNVLSLADPPFELDNGGQLVEIGPPDFRPLLEATVPDGTEHDLITAKIDAAKRRYRSRGATVDEQHAAVRDLADVLEVLRPDVKTSMLTADESALFQLANGFAIRHNNRSQQRDYDRRIWLRWAFYVYLATIHAVLLVREREAA